MLVLNATLDQSATPQNKVTKNATRQRRASAIQSSDEELISEDELEYDEDSLEDSGSEFQMSDGEDVIIGQDSDAEIGLVEALEAMDDDEAESAMLAAAIQMSMEKAQVDKANAVSSSSAGTSAPKTRSTAAALRAAAAEKRLTARLQDMDAENLENLDSFANPEESEMVSSSDSEPLARRKGKGKAKASKRKAAKVRSTTQRSRVKTVAQMKSEERAQKRATSAKSLNRVEEKKLIAKLGRKLTHVRIAPLVRLWS